MDARSPAPSGIDRALASLARGGDPSRALREVLAGAARAAGAGDALLLLPGDGPDRVLWHGEGAACARIAADRALREGEGVVRRTDPLAGLEAAAVPVVGPERVVAALAVAGPTGQLAVGPALRTAASTAALALERRSADVPVADLVDALARSTRGPDARGAVWGALDVLQRMGHAAGFAGVERSGRLEVIRSWGVEREHLLEVVGDHRFRQTLAGWRERPIPSHRSAMLRLERVRRSLVVAPVHDGGFRGLLAALVRGGESDEVGSVLEALAAHVSATLEKLRGLRDGELRSGEADAIVRTVAQPVVVLDAAGRFSRLNPAACDLFELSGSFDGGRPARGRLGSTELEALVLDSRRPGELTVELGRPARRYRAIVGNADDGSDRASRVLVLHDVTAEEEHRSARDDFVAVVGHELRTPLTVIRGSVETLLGRGSEIDGEQRDGFLGSVLRQTDRLHFLVEDLLLLSGHRRVTLDPSDVDLRDVVEAVVGDASAREPGREIEWLDLGGDTRADVDARRLAHVLHHLLGNALKYSDGPVRVELRGEGPTAEVSVVDQGPGIFSGDLQRLFEPFEQGDSSSTRSRGGTGVGLHVCRLVADAMGAVLDADTRLGQGSRFSLRLPRGPQDRAERPAAARDDAGA